MLKDQIVQLRKQGKTYFEISKLLGCDKATISYHLNPNVKLKSLKNQQIRRKNKHSYNRKLEFFACYRVRKCNPKNQLNIRRSIRSKIYKFSRREKKMIKYQPANFTVEDIINKFGENPICYLTGLPINTNKSSSYHFDHIIPVSRGGTSDLDNLGICTKQANQAKSDMTPDELINLCKLILEHHGYKVVSATTQNQTGNIILEE